MPNDDQSMPDEEIIPALMRGRRPKMPPEIAKAIVQVKKKVRQLGKDEENKFARFKYVSVDKFYDAVGRIMADAGIFVIVDERSVEAGARETANEQGQIKKAVWLTAFYELTIFHESGVEYGPIQRTMMVPATGPQSFGIGMSYVEKYFLRGVFKIPTGDEDADGEPQNGLPINQHSASVDIAKPIDEEEAARAVFYEIRSLVKASKSTEEIDSIVSSRSMDIAMIGRVSETGERVLREVVEHCREALLRQAPNVVPVP